MIEIEATELKHSLDGLLFSGVDMPGHYQQTDNSEEQDDVYSYAIVNGAGSDKVLMNLIAYEPEHRILFGSDDAEDLEDAAPWLVQLVRGEEYTQWLLEECFGQRLLLFMQSAQDIDSLSEHFKHYTKIMFPNRNDSDNHQVGFFSFYDPSIFPTWAESLTKEEAMEFFSPISNVWYEENNRLKLCYLKNTGWGKISFDLQNENTDGSEIGLED